MSRLEAMNKAYVNGTKKTTAKKKSTFSEKNYFRPFLKGNETTGQYRVRIIEPAGEMENPFKEIYGHKKQVEGKYPTFICPKKEAGEPCPFCQMRDLLLGDGTEESRLDARQYSQKKMYIVKLIDRDNPQDGVKFWRFNHHYKNTGTYDKINAALGTLPKSEDPFSSINGRDMIISVSKDGNNTVVTGINFDMVQTPLSSDADEVATWKADERTWRDGIYGIKPFDFLEIIVRGGVPVWQKNENGEEGGKYVDKASLNTVKEEKPEEFDNELTTIGVNTNNTVEVKRETVAESVVDTTSTSVEDEDEDDLPF